MCTLSTPESFIFMCKQQKFESKSNFLAFNSGIIYLTKTLSPSGLVRKKMHEQNYLMILYLEYSIHYILHVVSPFLPHQNEYFKFIHFSSLQPCSSARHV